MFRNRFTAGAVALMLGGSAYASTNAASDPHFTLMGQLSTADHVIVGDIVNFHRMQTKGGIWTESLVMFHVEGDALTKDGKKRIPGRYLLRGGVLDDVAAQEIVDAETTEQLIIVVNGNRISTVADVSFDNGLVVDTGTRELVRGIVDGNPVYAAKWNNPDCAPNADGSYTNQVLTDENGKTVTISVQEQIDIVAVQSCEDGTLWSRGRDKPDGYVDPEPMTATEFEARVVLYLARDNSAASVPRSGLQGNLNPTNLRLAVSEERKWIDVEMAKLFEQLPLDELKPKQVAFLVERLDYYGVPYSDKMNEIRDRFFNDNPRPSHAQQRPRPIVANQDK